VTRRRMWAALVGALAAAGLGGLPPRPVNAPRGQWTPPGVQPGVTNPIVRALQVIVGRKPSVQIQLFTAGTAGVLAVLYNTTAFTNGELLGEIQGAFAQMILNGPGNTAAGHKDFVGIEMNSSDGVSSSANMQFIYTDTGGGVHEVAYVDSGGFHVLGPLQIDGGVATLPLAAVPQFPVSGSATLATTITALNALYNQLVTGQVIA